MIPVNIILRFEVAAGPNEPGMEYMAIAHWLLPAVPREGEEVVALNHRIRVAKVQWSDDGRVAVHLAHFRSDVSVLATLESEGWDVGPKEDEPPSEWFSDG